MTFVQSPLEKPFPAHSNRSACNVNDTKSHAARLKSSFAYLVYAVSKYVNDTWIREFGWEPLFALPSDPSVTQMYLDIKGHATLDVRIFFLIINLGVACFCFVIICANVPQARLREY